MNTLLQVLSDDEKAQIHERTLKVLGTIGMRVDTDEGRRILGEAGAEVDEATHMVRFPAELIERSLAQVTRDLALGGRRPGWSHPLNAGAFTLLSDGGGTAVYDVKLGARRPPVHDDWVTATRVHDYLDDVGCLWCVIDYPADAEEPGGIVKYFTEVFATFGKHVQESWGVPALSPWVKETLDIIFDGPQQVAGLNPLSFLITPTSPLTIERDFTDSWLALRGYGIPTAIMPMPLQGATAPGSRLATILTANCEVIGTLCLVQAAAPGNPVIYAPVLATMDPRSGLYAAGAVEHATLCVASTEMARYYGLPIEASGYCTQHYEPDVQTAWEKAIGGMLVGLSNPDILVGPGMLGGATVFCQEQVIFDVEVSRLARQAHTGVPVRDDLWLDEILDKVGPCGTFLGEKTTRTNLRSGEWRLSDFGMHGSWDHWQAEGSKSSLQYASERVDEILATQVSLPYPDDVSAALADLGKRAAAAS